MICQSKLLLLILLCSVFSPEIVGQRLIDLDRQMADLTISAHGREDELGNSVAAGDLNGDGITDMIVGAPGKFATGHRGDVYVFYGKNQLSSGQHIDLNSQQADLHFIGKNTDDRFGFTLTAADFNGDQIDDLITVARSANAPGRIDAGVVYVFFGSKNWPANHTVDLAQVDADVTVLGENADDFMGTALAAGDINGDGLADLILGASWADPGGINRAGKVYVLFGAANFPAYHRIDLSTTQADLTFIGANATDNIGQQVFAADMTGDKFAEIIFSGWGVNVGNLTNAGAVYVFRGAAGWQSGTTIPLTAIHPDLLINGEATNFFTGDVLHVNDITGDGIGDLVISASYASPAGQIEKGRVYVVAGNNSFPPNLNINLSAADITIEAEHAGDRLGSALAGADVDHDGIGDLLIGARQADAAGGIDAGKIYTIRGDLNFPANHKIDLNNYQSALIIEGDNAGDYLGSSITGDDFDQNGLADLFCGAVSADPSGRPEGGKAYLLKGYCQEPPPPLAQFITGVPDIQQPPATLLPGTNPVNYCAPMAAVNIVGYWDGYRQHFNARGITAGLPLSQVAEYIGYFMDTNDAGSNDRANGRIFPSATGTYVVDQWLGFVEFLRWDQQHPFLTPPPALPTGKSGYNWTLAIDSTSGFSFYKSEIDAGRPAKIDFYLWSVIPTGVFYLDPTAGDTIEIYKWGQYASNSGEFPPQTPFEEWNFAEGQQGIGHAVTGVGYIENWTPACISLNADKFAIVHDNWATTAKNIAIPWAGWNVILAVDPAPPPQPVCRYIPNVPDENQPPQSGRQNWCSPTAAVNIVYYWDRVRLHKGALGVLDGWTPAVASDEIGWFMDTGNLGSPKRLNNAFNSGTLVADIEPGLHEFVRWDSTNLFLYKSPPASKSAYIWKLHTDYAKSFALVKHEIDQKRPLILNFDYWNLQSTGITVVDSASQDSIYVFNWGNPVTTPVDPDDPQEGWNFSEQGQNIGHTVTGVGYWDNFDPDGAGVQFVPSRWVIVHDNWASTPINVAIPWKNWNSSVTVEVPVPTFVDSDIILRVGTKKFVELQHNYPNPFYPRTEIRYKLAKAGFVRLTIYDSGGKYIETLVQKRQNPGVYRITFDAANLTSGFYFYKISVDGFRAARKMAVLH